MSWTLLYSKYSEPCKKMLEFLSKNRIEIQDENILCIDNKEVREQAKAKIKTVPAIIEYNLIIGSFNTYEGENAFMFIENIIKQNTPPSPPEIILNQLEVPKEENPYIPQSIPPPQTDNIEEERPFPVRDMPERKTKKPISVSEVLAQAAKERDIK